MRRRKTGAIDSKIMLAFCAVLISFLAVLIVVAHDDKVKNTIPFVLETWSKAKSIYLTKDGTQIDLEATLVIRMPERDSADHAYEPEKFTAFSQWLNIKFDGWTRWEVEAQSSNESIQKHWVYMIGLNKAMATDSVAKDVINYVSTTFPNPKGMLLIELTHPHIDNNKLGSQLPATDNQATGAQP